MLVAALQGWFAEFLRHHDAIPVERRGEYARAAAVLFARMTPTALLRVRRHVRTLRFYATLEELTVALARVDEKAARVLAEGRVAGGAYDGAVRCLHLDGGHDEPSYRDTLWLYGHEFSHALSGPERQISSSADWRAAWHEELIPNPVTPESRGTPHEGFAEFGAVLYSGVRRRKALEKHYPRCVEVWKGHGLW